MSGLLRNVEDQAKSLSTSDRARLLQTILESLHSDRVELEVECNREIARWIEAFDRGESITHPAEDVFA
ncbi:MAG: addiction module protein [Trueperaceae bacterium]|nr:addiction module protein [Trueperaceae bacterium]